MKSRKGPGPVPTLALLAALGVAGCAKHEAPAVSHGAPPPLPADVAGVAGVANPVSSALPAPAAASAAPLPGGPAAADAVAATGEFVSPVRSELAAKFQGRVARILVQEGARVRRGQPVLQMETEYLQLDADRARADLQRAQAVEADAKRDLDRKDELIAKGSVAQATRDRSLSAYDQARAARAGAEVSVATARQRLRDATLVSPVDGVVMEKRADVGQKLGDNSVTFVILQTAPLKLRFKLPEREMARVHEGQTVLAHVDPYPEEAFAGRVTTVVQAIDPASRSFVVEAEFANRDGRLRPGLFARVDLDARGRRGASAPKEERRAEAR